ncbi:MAG TPA: tetratricopeptide repeat protein [Stellaceae bacterium]|nr:tetratricopeptide repeat protein [Stellaceae bacterium]
MPEADSLELYEKGLAQQRAGQLKAALQIYNVLLKRGANDAALFVRSGECWEGLGDFGRADEAYGAAITRDPDLDLARRRAAALALRASEIARTAGQAATADDLRHGAVRYLAGLGERLIARGAFAEAEAAFRDASRIAPGEWSLQADLGRCLYEQGRFAAAERALRDALALAPAEPLCHFHLGVLMERQDRRAEAESAFRQALALAPGLAPAAAGLARLGVPAQNPP